VEQGNIQGNIRWIVGTVVSLTIAAVTTLLSFQGKIDAGQDMQIVSAHEKVAQVEATQQEINRELAENNRKVAEALQAVTATLKAIDEKGTQALREHERLNAEEGH
jgi:predicted nucleotide-binding protein (sugar kinase/HSP70/actin superfamily)